MTLTPARWAIWAEVRHRRVTGVTVVSVRGHLVAVEAHVDSSPAHDLDAEPDPADAEVLQSLMSVGSQSALEVLG